MKKKLKLNSESDFPKNFIGISSHYKDIQIVWSLNNIARLNFTKTNDFSKEIKNSKDTFHFSMFLFIDENNIKHFFIANKTKEAVLFPKYKTIDYFYISNLPFEKLNLLVKDISKSKMVSGSFILPTDKLISNTFKEIFEE